LSLELIFEIEESCRVTTISTSYFSFSFISFLCWARLVRGLGPIKVEKGWPSLCKGERLVRGGGWKANSLRLSYWL